MYTPCNTHLHNKGRKSANFDIELSKTYFFQFVFYLKNYFRKKRKCNWNNKYIFRLKPQSFQC